MTDPLCYSIYLLLDFLADAEDVSLADLLKDTFEALEPFEVFDRLRERDPFLDCGVLLCRLLFDPLELLLELLLDLLLDLAPDLSFELLRPLLELFRRLFVFRSLPLPLPLFEPRLRLLELAFRGVFVDALFERMAFGRSGNSKTDSFGFAAFFASMTSFALA